jgi:hypothetical protein
VKFRSFPSLPPAQPITHFGRYVKFIVVCTIYLVSLASSFSSRSLAVGAALLAPR